MNRTRILNCIRPDDIVLLHDNRPPDEGLISVWLNEIENLLTDIETIGFMVLPLSKLTGKPVMITKIGEVDEESARKMYLYIPPDQTG